MRKRLTQATLLSAAVPRLPRVAFLAPGGFTEGMPVEAEAVAEASAPSDAAATDAPPPPNAPPAVTPDLPAACEEAGGSSDPWVLRLGNYLGSQRSENSKSDDQDGWALRLGNYLKERQPGPWSIIANEKPQDPLALRLGTFLNETKPISVLHSSSDADAVPAEPIVLRLGNYLNGGAGAHSLTAHPCHARDACHIAPTSCVCSRRILLARVGGGHERGVFRPRGAIGHSADRVSSAGHR